MQKLLVAGALAPFCIPLSVTSVSAQPDSADADQIIVTGIKFPTPLDQVGRSVSVVTEEDIQQRQVNFLFDAIATTPGVQFRQQGGGGTLATVSIRGIPSNVTLVVQDGVVINDPSTFDNLYDFSFFDVGDVERVEVLRGAQSTLYGSDAVGGVISVVTKDGRDGFGANGYLEGGAQTTFRGGASLYGGDEMFSARASITAATSNGFSAADEDNGNEENDGYETLTASGKARFAPSDAFEFVAIGRYQDSRVEFDGFDTGPVDGDEVGLTEALTLSGTATHTAFDGALENRVSVGYYVSDRLNRTDGAPSFDGQGKRTAFEYQATVKPLEQLSLIAGTEYDIQESEVAVGFGADEKINTIAGFGLAQLRPLPFLTLNAGVRHDTSDLFGGATTITASGALNVPNTGLTLRASYGEGFRAPSAAELSFNGDLRPEQSDGFDIGIEYGLLDGRVRLSATYFDQQIEELIAFDSVAFTFVNVQKFSAEGVEVAAEVTANEWLDVDLTYSYVDALNLSTNLAAVRQPKHRVSLETAMRPSSRSLVALGVVYNGPEFVGAARLDDFFLVNLRGSFELSERLELYGRIENLLDANYQDDLGYGAQPFSPFMGVRVRL